MPEPDLTRREYEVLDLVRRGLTNRQIAQQLHVTEQTVKSHLQAMFRKMGVPTRAAAIAAVYERGISLVADGIAQQLDALDVDDPELAHGLADQLLMQSAPQNVQAAYRRVAARLVGRRAPTRPSTTGRANQQ